MHCPKRHFFLFDEQAHVQALKRLKLIFPFLITINSFRQKMMKTKFKEIKKTKAWFSLATQALARAQTQGYQLFFHRSNGFDASRKSEWHIDACACACGKHKHKICPFCVIVLVFALVLASLVKTRLKTHQILTMKYSRMRF